MKSDAPRSRPRRRGPARVARPGDARRYVYVAAPRCPSCGGRTLLVYKTRREAGEGANGGGAAVYRYTRCVSCGWRFIVVEE